MSGSTTPENLLEGELTCSVCLDIFRDPRLLPCGHNLCLLCVQELRKQRGNGQSFSCPECRQECAPDAALQKNRKLANIAEEFRKNRGEDPAAVFCDCCLQKTAAVRLCLKCEVALCGDHVRLHTERPAFRDHTLTELGQDPAKRKCPEHGEVFRFYCVQDEAALCSSCTVQRQHKGHDMKTYKELAEEFKGSLEDLLQRVNGKLSENQKLLTEQERSEKMITNNPIVEEGLEQLRERLRALVDSLVSELRQHCEAQSRDAAQALQTNHRALKQERQGLESIRADINALLQISDPLSFIEIFHSKRDKICKDLETPLLKPDPVYLNRKETFEVMDSRSRNFTADALVQIRELKSRCCGDLPALDVNTAHHFIKISNDLLSATNVGRSQSYPDHPDRFDHYEQVLTLQSISSGTHYWEIEVQGGWRVGVAYNTIKRKGREDGRCLGRGKDSWSFKMVEKKLAAWHDNKETALPVTLTHSRVALSLDYGAGTVSFHDVGDALTHLHTFSTTFTQPVCLGFALFSGQKVSSVSIVKM